MMTLVDALKSGYPVTERIQAAEALVGYEQSAAVPVTKLLHSEDERARYYACFALNRLGPYAEGAVADLIAIAADPKDPLQRDAVRALGRVGPAASPATPVLCKLLGESDSRLEDYTIMALAEIGGNAVPVLVENLRCDDSAVRQSVCTVLQRLGPKAKAAVPALVALVLEADPELYDAAFLALAEIGSSAVCDLTHMLQSDDRHVRRGAAMALSRMGGAVIPAVPALCDATNDQDANIRFWAVRALGEIGNSGGGVTDCLIHASRDPDADVRWQTVVALQKLGVGKSTQQALVHLLDDAHPAVRAKARKIGLPAEANRDNT